MPGSRGNAPGVYLKNSRFDPAFIRGRRLIEVQRLIEKIRYAENALKMWRMQILEDNADLHHCILSDTLVFISPVFCGFSFVEAKPTLSSFSK